MFDTLTLDGLNAFHEQLFNEHQAIHARLSGPAQDIAYGPAWDTAHAAAVDMTKTMLEVGREINRRLQTPAPRLDGCTCDAIAGSHRSGCQWAAHIRPVRLS